MQGEGCAPSLSPVSANGAFSSTGGLSDRGAQGGGDRRHARRMYPTWIAIELSSRARVVTRASEK